MARTRGERGGVYQVVLAVVQQPDGYSLQSREDIQGARGWAYREWRGPRWTPTMPGRVVGLAWLRTVMEEARTFANVWNDGMGVERFDLRCLWALRMKAGRLLTRSM